MSEEEKKAIDWLKTQILVKTDKNRENNGYERQFN